MASKRVTTGRNKRIIEQLDFARLIVEKLFDALIDVLFVWLA
jgi:hypothetical protein